MEERSFSKKIIFVQRFIIFSATYGTKLHIAGSHLDPP